MVLIRLQRAALFFSLMLFIQSVSADGVDKFKEGKDYLLLPAELRTGSNSEKVIEFFSYSCPYCYRMERAVNIFLQNKKDDITFERIPVFLWKEHNYEVSVYAYLIAEKLGVVDKFHEYFFDLIHVPYWDEKAAYNGLANISDVKKLFTDNGIPEKDFDNAYKFFEKNETVKSNDMLAAKYKVAGTPAFIVRGKYYVGTIPAGIGGERKMAELLLYLSQK